MMEKRILIPLLFLCLMGYGCTPHEFVVKKNTPDRNEITETVTPDSNLIEVPPEYKRPYVIGHGIAFGIIGFFAVGYLTFTWGNGLKIGEECSDCPYPELFWIGGSVGFVGGYIFGTHVGSQVAKIKYRKKQHQKNGDRSPKNNDSSDNKEDVSKSKL